MKMKFSVIIPVYNAEKYIERAIDSIVKQDYKDYEMILINDGSTDRSFEIIQRLAERNTRIRVESIVNEGVSHARNKGIELANGEYVLFMDADDMHEENTLQQIEDFLVKYDNPDCFCFGFTEYTEENGKLTKKNQVNFPDLWLKDEKEIDRCSMRLINETIFGSVWSKAYKREMLNKYNIRMPEDMFVGEDYCFNLDVLAHCREYATAKNHFYKYMLENSESIIRKYNPVKFEQMYKMHERRKKFILDHTDCNSIEKEAQIRCNFVRLCMSCFMDLFRKECSYTYRQKIAYIREKRSVEKDRYHKEYLRYFSSNYKVVYTLFSFLGQNGILLLAKACFCLKFYLGKNI